MADPTDAEKAAEAQKAMFKGLVKDAINEVIAEQTPKQRTTGQPVEEAAKPRSFFEIFSL